jgi:hypothetical protein
MVCSDSPSSHNSSNTGWINVLALYKLRSWVAISNASHK